MIFIPLKRKITEINLKRLNRDGVSVGEGTLIFPTRKHFGSEPYLVHIGENCLIANGVHFITHDGAIRIFNKSEEYKHIDNKYGKIDIKDNVYIGENSIIMPNVTIGPNACVLPGSVVYKSLPPNSVSCGNPAGVKTIVDNFEEYYNNEIFKYYKKLFMKFSYNQAFQILMDM